MDIYVSLDQLAAYAYREAEKFQLKNTVRPCSLRNEIAKNIKKINNSTEKMANYASASSRIPGEIEWMLDNRYVAEREAKTAYRTLKWSGSLRAVEGEALIIRLASVLLDSGGCELSRSRLENFLSGFQRVMSLSERELSLLPCALRAVLIERLALLAEEICHMLDIKAHGTPEDAFFIEELVRKGEADREKAEKLFTEAESAHECMNRKAQAIFTSLRYINDTDISAVLEKCSIAEHILMDDPSGVYGKMDRESRAIYRYRLAVEARENGLTDEAAAKIVLELSKKEKQHVGYFILTDPLGKGKKRKYSKFYAAVNLFPAIGTAAALSVLCGNIYVFFISLFPIFEISRRISDYIVIKSTRPERLPRLEYKDGIPACARTLCAVVTMISSENAIKKYTRLLEEYKIANRDAGDQLIFALLADLPEANNNVTDKDASLMDAAEREITALNKKYGGGFLFLTRERKYSERDGIWRGWERKRGAVMDLISRIKGNGGVNIGCGNALELMGVKYLIVLDSDTRLTNGSAAELVSIMEHPLNLPKTDKLNRTVQPGYGILQPRIALDLKSAGKSDFSSIFGGQGGIDPYSSVYCDVYQDLFRSGSFSGKGIISVQAMDECLTGRFPEYQVLSHDLLEGAYLGSGFTGDVELTDSFPSGVSAYYARMDRWIRGDWQTLPWLGKHIKNEIGDKEKNPISFLNKWKIFDNLCRSLTAPLSLVCFILAAFADKVFRYAAAAALIALACKLILSLTDMIGRPGDIFKRHYTSRVIYGLQEALIQFILRLILLPYEAFVCACAIFKALYRMLISHRNLLEWVTAEEWDDKNPDGILQCYYKMWFSIVIGILCIVFSPSAFWKAAGVLWLAAPAVAFSLSRQKNKAGKIAPDDAFFLKRCASDIWKFYSSMLTNERNCLPPDNIQKEPGETIAERTSPTNIGLALLSVAAGSDMKLCSEAEEINLLKNMLYSIERLPKWKGLMYNWYDIKTMCVMFPAYISTVDCGNYLACLIALRSELKRLNQPELLDITNKLIDECRLGILYDTERKLFRIGYDAEKCEFTDGWYDLMASEARLTSYVAVARGDIQRKHWRCLGRLMACDGAECGLVSWTGSMFEYFMPSLLLPSYRNSLMHDTLRFCLNAQKRAGDIWGISESSFYSFDHSMNYRYKAHGVQNLALKRGMDEEKVISPYSSFLALETDIHGAVRNLKKLKAAGTEGVFGFYEALDRTSGRGSAAGGETVKCFMAHHLGMSIISIDNAVNDKIMQKRFMSDEQMAAFRELLEEKGPVGQVISKEKNVIAADKPERLPSGQWKNIIKGVNIEKPKCCIIGNGAYSVLLTELGTSYSKYHDISINKFSGARYGCPEGISFYLRERDTVTSLQGAPEYAENTSYYSEMSMTECKIFTSFFNTECCTETVVPQNETGEIRTVTIKNLSDGDRNVELIFYLEPILAKTEAFDAHPAFSRLGLETVSDGKILTVKRRPGSGDTIYLSVGCSREYEFDTFRQNAFGRGGLKNLRQTLKAPAGMTAGAPIDPCVFIRVKLFIKAKTEEKLRFCIAAGKSDETVHAVKRMLERKKTIRSNAAQAYTRQLDITSSGISMAMEMLSQAVFGYKRANMDYIRDNSIGRNGLWKFGVSGDIPVIAIKLTQNDIKKAERLIKCHGLLNVCGFNSDLVLITEDGGSYFKPAGTMISECAAKLGCENSINIFGGIHIVECSEHERKAIFALADVLPDGDEKCAPENIKNDATFFFPENANTRCEYVGYFNPDDSYSFETYGGLHDTVWSSILTNGSIGYIASDCGSGNIWYKNAREKRINAWTNDFLADTGTEKITCRTGTDAISVFAACDNIPCTVTFGFGYAVWRKKYDGGEIRTTAFVHPDIDARIMIIEFIGFNNEADLEWESGLLLGEDKKSSKNIYIQQKENSIYADSSDSVLFNGRFTQCSNARIKSFKTSDYPETSASAVYSGEKRYVLVSGIADEEKLRRLAAPDAAYKALIETKAHWKIITGKVRIKTPSNELNRYINGWAIYQIVACRIMGRSSLYQSGGAYGFRDQLQDVSAISAYFPELTKKQIIMSAAHQYLEGDVMHWWHSSGSEGDRGVRTRCSDDLLWLPYAVCNYIETTGDRSILFESADYLQSAPLQESEHDRYENAVSAGKPESILDHCARAAELVLKRGKGENGLLMIGSGDWNDGFNALGGESEWLTWFAAGVLKKMSEYFPTGKDEIYRQEAEALGKSADLAWDGQWYFRGTWASGKRIGSHENIECQIDSIAQSFAVISSFGSTEKARIAVNEAYERLYDKRTGTVALFTPAFNGAESSAGYISGYIPGTRENGGQYTHAAVWLAIALLRCGETEKGWNVINTLLPGGKDIKTYKVEPYVIAADIYTNSQHEGRGGWSWYTGAAGWLFRAVCEEMLGIKTESNAISVAPRLPEDWKGYDAAIENNGITKYISVSVNNTGEKGNESINSQIVQK